MRRHFFVGLCGAEHQLASSSDPVTAIRAADWERYEHLAKLLPEHHVLSIQLLRTQDEQTVAIFTTVQHGQAVRSVLMGDVRGQAEATRAEPRNLVEVPEEMTPDTIALGEPPIKQPITPGMIALGTPLLSAAFDASEPSAAAPASSDRAHIPLDSTPDEVTAIRAADWERYERLATLLPDHDVLSIQLLRTRSNETAAIFTTAQHGQAVRSVLMGNARGQADPNRAETQDLSEVPGDLTPAGIALGQPPVQQPITPGLIALGTPLLSAAFDVDDSADPQ